MLFVCIAGSLPVVLRSFPCVFHGASFVMCYEVGT